jgi:hypothetical protein
MAPANLLSDHHPYIGNRILILVIVVIITIIIIIISNFSALAGKYSPILGFSNQKD